jgi:hypothetical protein
MSHPFYLWQGKEVFTCSTWDEVLRHSNHFAYDPAEDEFDDRWGMVSKGRWWPRDPNSIPPEFKLQLLLITGVL